MTLVDVTELKRVEESLAAKLNAMARLHQLSTSVVESVELEPPLRAVLDAIVELLHADFGNIQLYDSDGGNLHIAAQRGFDERYLDHFAEVDVSDASVYAEALRTREQVLIEDIEQEPSYRPSLEWAAAAGYRAVQSTPLIVSNDTFVGVLSTHFGQPRRFLAHDLRLIDICARQAADAIKIHRLQESLRKTIEARELT